MLYIKYEYKLLIMFIIGNINFFHLKFHKYDLGIRSREEIFRALIFIYDTEI